MIDAIRHDVDRSTSAQIEAHLRHCDEVFIPPLGARLRIEEYAAKLALHARRLEAWDGQQLVGLVAMYCNDLQSHTAYITNVSVAREWARHGIARRLLGDSVTLARAVGMDRISLQVAAANHAAISLYRKLGWVDGGAADNIINMELNLNMRTSHATAT